MISDWRLTFGNDDPILKTAQHDENMCQSRITGEPHSVAYVAVFLDIPKPTLYRWMQRGDLPYEGYGGLTDRHIGIEDTMRVKAAKRPGRPKKRDAKRVRNLPVNYELAATAPCRSFWVSGRAHLLGPCVAKVILQAETEASLKHRIVFARLRMAGANNEGA